MRKLFESITKRWIGTKTTISNTRKTSAFRNHLNGFEPLEQRQLLSVSEGLAAMNIDDVQDRFFPTGYEGYGVKVGVIADGYTTSTDLPTGTVTTGTLGAGSGTTGTAMLEVINDIAPYADLYFAPADTATDFEAAVAYLTGQGVDVIVADSGIYEQPWFEDGDAADAVAAAISSGTIFVGAAGDDGELHYQDTFSQYSTTDRHDFGGSQYLAFDVSAGTVNVSLEWDNTWNSATSDYDLWLYGWTGSAWTYVSSSADSTGLTFESVSFDNSGSTYSQMAVSVRNPYGDASVTLELMIDGSVSAATSGNGGASIAYSEEDAIFGPSALTSSITVGAVDYTASSWDSVTADSSRGGSTVDGTTRNSLDVVAMDHVSTSILGTTNFAGTAASAAHVGGMAVLAVQAAGANGWDLTAAEFEAILQATAIDIETTGYDNLSGAGLIDALEAAYFMYEPGAPTLDSGSDTGYSNSDLLTNDITPTFTGVVPPSSYVELQVNFQGTWYPVAATTADATTGAYSLTFDADAAIYGLLGVNWSSAFDGDYDLRVGVASSSTGEIYNWSDTTTVTIDTAAPTAAITAISPDPRDTVVTDVEITFDELVYGLTVSDLSLTLDSTPVAISGVTATPDAATLTTSYDLTDFSGLTADHGTYVLDLATGAITDEAGNALTVGASDTWDKYDVIIEGTSGDDVVIVTTDGTDHTVDVNGTVTVYSAATYETLYFNGGGGTDKIYVYGSDDPDALVSGPDVSTLDWGSDGVNLTINDFDRLYAYGSADDTAEMTGDAAGSNRFYAYPAYSIVSNAVSVNRATGFGTVTALPGGGTDNRAYLYDGTGADMLTATSSDATQTWATGEVATASGFDRVYVEGSTGDTAEITGDSAGGNRMYAYETHTIVTTASSFIQVNGFDSVTTTAGGTTDNTAYLYGGSGVDDLTVTPDSATMDWSTGVSAVAQDFARVYADGSTGDSATLTGDSAGGNRFYGYDTRAILSTPSLFVQASNFDTVTATAAGTTDNKAYLYGGSGVDDLTVTPDSATMDWSTGVSAVAQDFARVYAYGSAGDTAEFTGDSAGGNRFYGYDTRAILSTSSSFAQASGFDMVTATAGGTTDNKAYLYGGSGADDLTVTPTDATMDWSTGVSALAQDFARVYAYGSTGDNAELSGDSAGGNRFYGYDTRSIYTTASSFAQASGFDMVTATAGGATDSRAYLYGGSGIDDLSVAPTSSTMDWSTGVSAVADGFGRIYAEGASEDNATITGDGAGDARFYGYDSRSIYTTSSFFVQASDFGTVTANPNGGTGNKAYLYDDAGTDSVTLLPTVATRDWANGAVATAESFDKVYAYGSAGDTANLTGDGAGGNRLYAYDTSSILTRPSSTAQVSGFDSVQVSAGGGTDNRLYLYDGTGADVVDITTDTATRDWSTGESVSTDGFERVYAYGDAGDSVSMTGDSAGSNWLYGYADHTILSCSLLFSQVSGFDSISVTAGGGIDNRIYMYDTDGADTFTFNQTSLTAELAPTIGTPIQIDADGFDLMRVYATSGTGDVAYLNGTTGADTFLGYDDSGYLTDTSGSDYYNYVRSVDEVHVDSGDSEDGNDDLNIIGTLAYNLLTYGSW